jgi:uncharacterized protein (DUF1697 family)
MPTHIAMLRAVNVGGRFMKMADLVRCLEKAGLADVETYIQTGNVRFTTSTRSRAKVERHLEEALLACFGFEVVSIVFSPAELTRIHQDAGDFPVPLPGTPRQYVAFLKSEPSEEAVRRIADWSFEGERAIVRRRAVHIWLTVPSHQAKTTNARIERAVGPATTRDLKVVARLAERWGCL